MSYEETLFDEVISEAAEELSPDDATDLREWVESLEDAKRKADEYEAKAKAWDNMKRDFEEISNTPMAQHILFNMSLIMEDVESGESDA